jgi:hypothetical protein
MIDNFALALSHGLLLLTAWRLLFGPHLADDYAAATPQRSLWRRSQPGEDPPGA